MTDIRSYFGRPIGRQVARIPAASRETTRPLENKVSSISRRRFLAKCKDVCSICLDSHQKGDSVTAQCGHEFGKQCWEQFLASNDQDETLCPLCRNVCHFVTGYKQRKLTKREQYNILVVNLWTKMDETSAAAYKRFLLDNPSATTW